jgi:hypothetical protein
MEAGIREVALEMTHARDFRQPITEKQVWDWLDLLAAARQRAVTHRDGKIHLLYGVPTPRTLEDIPKYETFLFQWSQIKDSSVTEVTYEGKSFIRVPSAQALIAVSKNLTPTSSFGERSHWDIVNERERHKEFYSATQRAFQLRQSQETPSAPGITPFIELTRIKKENEEFFIIHPNFNNQIKIKKLAISLILIALNQFPFANPELLQSAIGQSYFLFSHAPPFTLGTPSVIESFFEAVLRAKLYQTIAGNKIDEPFWKAVLWTPSDKNTIFSFNDFLACFEPRL